jgi:predicted nucleotidyltransferase
MLVVSCSNAFHRNCRLTQPIEPINVLPMKTVSISELPKEYQKDVAKASGILRAAGSKGLFLFGSLANGSPSDDSDIDLAITGIPANRFFELYAKAGRELDHELDLVDLDHEEEFARFLMETDRLVQLD